MGKIIELDDVSRKVCVRETGGKLNRTDIACMCVLDPTCILRLTANIR